MKNLMLFLCLFLLFTSCSPSSGSDEQIEIRIISVQYSLGMIHNSHLNRGFPSERSAFSAMISFEIFLSEGTDHTNIHSLRIIDEELEGWDFTTSEILDSYNPDLNSLSFQTLDLRQFDIINGKLFKAQVLDEEGNLVRENGFSLDNTLPLPASTNNTFLESFQLEISFDFYETPYDGGSIPFPVKIYNTVFSSNTFSFVWLDENKNFIQENFANLNLLTPVASPNTEDIYAYQFNSGDIPENAKFVYSRFLRGNSISGRVLLTKIDEIHTGSNP